MKKYIAIFAAVLALCSCQSLKEEFQPVFTGEYQAPDAYRYYQDSDFGKIITIAQLASCYKTGNPFEMPAGDKKYSPTDEQKALLAGAVIKGTVISTDKPGNFYKSFFIQDQTGGMEIKVGKNGLYNDYLPGQTVYVKLDGLTLGMYGFKSGNYGGMGMVQIGFADPSGEYETSYMEIGYLIDKHILRGNPAEAVPAEPIEMKESDFPDGKTATQAKSRFVGSLVTIRNLRYSDEIFCLLYLDSNKDKKSYTNRIFLSDTNGIEKYGKTHGIKTLAMSESQMKEYLYAGCWDDCLVGSGNEYLLDDNGNQVSVGMLRGDGSYPAIEKAAYSVSQYFSTPSGIEVQIRTSGFCKFANYPIPADVLDGSRRIDVTGILSIYNGSFQFTVNSADDFVYSDTKEKLYK
ncbi:MAG: DUF5689 domain-containing protein [Bacteroidales bacterium]|nr:DUF5689 domain-containing protein [Bacteroidales bacterium]